MDEDEWLLGLFLGGAALGFTKQFHGGGQRILLVRRVQIKVNAAERARFITLAEDDGDLPVNGQAVPHAGRAAFVSFDRFVEQADECGLEFFRGLFETDDVFVERLHSGGDFFFETIGSHRASLLQRRLINREKSQLNLRDQCARPSLRPALFLLRIGSGIDAQRIGSIIQE